MQDQKLDRRSAKTRQACLGAFTDLLLRDGYEALSVSDIIASANVGRSTFYDHYNGKEDLLRECIANPFGALADAVLPGATASRLTMATTHFLEQKRLVRSLLTGQPRSLMVRSLAEMIEERMRTRTYRGHPLLPAGLASAMIAESQLGLILHWLAGTEACRPEEVAAALLAATSAQCAALGALF